MCRDFSKDLHAYQAAKQRCAGYPWMITLDVQRKDQVGFHLKRLKIFMISIREQQTHKLVADFPNIPLELKSECNHVLDQAIRMCCNAGRKVPFGTGFISGRTKGKEFFTMNGVLFDEFDNSYMTAETMKQLLENLLERRTQAVRTIGREKIITRTGGSNSHLSK
ncbi:MAG: hypothetical protein LBT05_10645 [Planctomycetaceae bacterium]|nr:hypothetical protein [Planctomycetaceae bacterium]